MNQIPFTAWCATLFCVASSLHAADPLPSWNDGNAKQSITAFVEKVTKEGTSDFVTPVSLDTFDQRPYFPSTAPSTPRSYRI